MKLIKFIIIYVIKSLFCTLKKVRNLYVLKYLIMSSIVGVHTKPFVSQY